MNRVEIKILLILVRYIQRTIIFALIFILTRNKPIMRVKNYFYSFAFLATMASAPAVSFGHDRQGVDKTEIADQSADKDFESFLEKFTTSATFQYSRVKFPLESPIVLTTKAGFEKTFPFTKEKWSLLNTDYFKEEKVLQEEDGIVYVTHFVVDEPDHKEFEAGYEESELDLRVVFKRIAGKWYVTDCYNAWFGFDLPAEEIEETIKQVEEENAIFIEEHP